MPRQLVDKEHWNELWSKPPRHRLPSRLVVSTRDVQNLLRQKINPGDSVLEIGFAPGKMLVWASIALKAKVCGIDYSPQGVKHAQNLFEALNVDAPILLGDVFDESLVDMTFDCVYSLGVIEHFENPVPIIQRHVDLLKPGALRLF